MDIAIDSIAAGGDGVGRAGALVVFVPRTAPGDVADVDVTMHGRFARGTLRRLRTASPLRTEPACAHYVRDRCGGCQLQHLRYDAQLDAKGHIIRDALERIGRRPTPVPPAVRASATPWRYRRTLTLALRRRRGQWLAGLHPYDDPARVFALRDCPITEERVLAVWREILLAAADLPDGPALRGSVRIDGDDASFVLEGGTQWTRSGDFFDRAASLAALWWVPEGRPRVELHTRRAGGTPGASFAQVNAAVADALRRDVVARVVAYAPRSVIDAYAGLGDTAALLATPERRVTAVELDPAAAAWCASRLGAGSSSVAGRVEDVLPALLPADVVIVNPPRTGVDARVTTALDAAAGEVRAVVYVSCNPATLARDLARLPAWRVASLAAFDMFPHTAHVETVCELVPEGR